MTYPNSPGYAKGSATSKAAADSLPDLTPMCRDILKELYTRPNGLIVDEVKQGLELSSLRTFDRSTIAARFTELTERSFIKETEYTRKTPRGRQATVYVITIKGRDFLLNN